MALHTAVHSEVDMTSSSGTGMAEHYDGSINNDHRNPDTEGKAMGVSSEGQPYWYIVDTDWRRSHPTGVMLVDTNAPEHVWRAYCTLAGWLSNHREVRFKR